MFVEVARIRNRRGRFPAKDEGVNLSFVKIIVAVENKL
jgi:hypothetical protein